MLLFVFKNLLFISHFTILLATCRIKVKKKQHGAAGESNLAT